MAGGGYLWLFPYRFLRWAIRRINRAGQPAILYLHPWELDPDQPRLKGSLVSNFRQYVNLDKTEGKLKRLLKDFRFGTIKEVLSTLPFSSVFYRDE